MIESILGLCIINLLLNIVTVVFVLAAFGKK